MAQRWGKGDIMKTISIVVPTYNEEENVPLVIERIRRIFTENLTDYSYEIIFADNCSLDGTRGLIKNIPGKTNELKLSSMPGILVSHAPPSTA